VQFLISWKENKYIENLKILTYKQALFSIILRVYCLKHVLSKITYVYRIMKISVNCGKE